MGEATRLVDAAEATSKSGGVDGAAKSSVSGVHATLTKQSSMSTRDMLQLEAKLKREEEAAYERAAIAEAITFAKQKDKEKERLKHLAA